MDACKRARVPAAGRPPVRRVSRCPLLLAAAAASVLGMGLAGAPPAPAATSTGYLSTPTDQIAVPGMLAGAEITPEGDLYTGWAEYELRFGPRLAAWEQPTRTLPDPGLPLLASTLHDGPVSYTDTVFAVALAGRPVAYETVTASNGSATPQEAQVAMAVAYTRGPQIRGVHGLPTGAYRYERPVSAGAPGFYHQPGQRFSPTFSYSAVGRDLDRSGLLLARGPAAPSSPLVTPAARSPAAVHDERLFRALLQAHRSVGLTWQIPLEPPVAGAGADRALDGTPLAAARAELKSTWDAQEAGMMAISVPEPKVVATYRAAIAEILSSRYPAASGWVQATNKLQYQAFWIRDAVIDTEALDLAGLHAQAAQNLAFIDTFQGSDGLFISRPGQYDGLGQALWALYEHAVLTQDPAYASAALARIALAVAWLTRTTAADRLGLLPPADPGDDELAHGHIAGDDLWAAAGLRSAIAAAALAGRTDLAGTWSAIDARFEASLRRALAAAVARAGHIPPVLDSAGGEDWGNYDAAYPVEVLPPDSSAVRATVAWARAHMAEGLATYEHGHSLHDYLAFSIFQTELLGGDVSDALAGLYSELAHTTSTDGGWEWGIAPYGTRASEVNLSPHGTFAGDYVALLRDMLVADTPGGGVSLLAGASPAWLAPGEHITVTAAPTARGVISFSERSSARGETLTWQSDLVRGTALTWTLPWWARDAHLASGAPVGSRVALPSASGSIAVTFAGRRPSQSYAATVAALNASYRARSRPEPLVAGAG